MADWNERFARDQAKVERALYMRVAVARYFRSSPTDHSFDRVAPADMSLLQRCRGEPNVQHE